MSQGKKIKSRNYSLRNRVDFFESGQLFFDKLEELIRSAQFEIHLQTYILSTDTTGQRILDSLTEAAAKGVKIYVLIDAFGSQKLGSAVQRKLVASGIMIRKYGVFFNNGRFHIGRRLHQKIIVIDGFTSVVGGINLSDNYNDMPLSKAWLDFAVVIRGEASRKLQMVCRRYWLGYRNRQAITKIPVDKLEGEGRFSRIRVRRNDFIFNLNEIALSYREGIRAAQKSLTIVGGYFLPGGKTRRLLKNAIKRGVQIKVLTAEDSDVKLMVYARRYLYKWLIENNIQLFSYDLSNVHGKIMIVDKSWTTIGSYDMNNLSTYSNIELNVDIDDPEFSQSLTERLNEILKKQCTEITDEYRLLRKNYWMDLKSWLAYRIVKTFFFLSVTLAGKGKKEI